MFVKKNPKLVSETILPQSILDENIETLDIYKETADILKETTDILEQTAIALGKKQSYEYSFSSTQNCEINHHAIPPTTASYKI